MKNVRERIADQMLVLVDSFGEALNTIQDVAETVLTKSEWKEFLKKSNRDSEKCADMDGILLNDEYFDWREFSTRKREIILAFLNYFSEDELARISNKI